MEMSLEKLQKWSKEFQILSDPFRLAILFILYGSQILGGAHCLTFSQLRTMLKTSKSSTLAYHLAKLVEAELLEKIPIQEDKTKRIYPVYRLSDHAIKLIEDFGLRSHMLAYLEERGIAVRKQSGKQI